MFCVLHSKKHPLGATCMVVMCHACQMFWPQNSHLARVSNASLAKTFMWLVGCWMVASSRSCGNAMVGNNFARRVEIHPFKERKILWGDTTGYWRTNSWQMELVSSHAWLRHDLIQTWMTVAKKWKSQTIRDHFLRRRRREFFRRSNFNVGFYAIGLLRLLGFHPTQRPKSFLLCIISIL